MATRASDMKKFIYIASAAMLLTFSSCARSPYEIPPTSQSTPTITPTTTPAFATSTPKTETTVASYHCDLWEPLISDDHEWVAISKSCQNPGLPSLEIIGAGGKNWIFESEDFNNTVVFANVIWSENREHVYFSATHKSTHAYFYDSIFSILKMNLEDGKVETLLDQEKKCKGHPFNSGSLSTDEKLIAYLLLNNPPNNSCKGGLVVYDLFTKEKRQISLDNYYDGGFFLWSNDLTKLAFIVSELDSTAYYPKNETVMVLDLASMTLESLATTEHGYVFLPHEWINDQLVIKDRTNDSLLIFDSNTNQFIPFTP